MIAANTLIPPTTVEAPRRVHTPLVIPHTTCLDLVKTPRHARTLARGLTFLFIGTIVGLAFLPWQQTVVGRGQVLAFKPTERQQAISAPIGGLVTTWHVVEGSRVKTGDPICDLTDPDPKFEERLKSQREFLVGRTKQFNEQIARRRQVIAEQTASRDARLEIATKQINIARQTVEQRTRIVGTTTERYELANKELALFSRAVDQGLRPEIDAIRLRTQVNVAKLEAERAGADLKAAEESLAQAQAAIPGIRADATSVINTSQQEIERLEGEKFAIDGQVQDIDVRLSRFAARFVKAPCDGTVFRIEENAGQGGAQVKEGAPLAIIVPDSNEYVVELFIDGVDAPLIQKDPNGRYPHVRLQFEGWPAVQFTGWPSAAYGTFGGRVKQIDQTDNGKGQFRVLIEPEPMLDDDEWPSQEFLRQGNQAVGWVFLNRVTLGWEVWRRLNGFPPVVAPEEPGKKKK